MADIENKIWNGEILKAVIKFDPSSSLEYTVYTSLNTGTATDIKGNFIKDIEFSLSEGNDRVNPLGVAISNTISIEIFDSNDNLSPTNINSPYYGKIVNGIEIDLYITYDGASYEPYGIYYTTSWSGEYSEGYHGLAYISAEDKLNTIGNYDMPELEVYSNIEVSELIKNVFNGIGIDDDKYSIDTSLNMNMLYGTSAGLKVRDFLNNICQIMFARVIIDREGIIRFVPAISIYDNSNTIEISTDYTGSFKNKYNNNINYNKVKVKYLDKSSTVRDKIFSDSSHSLTSGNNTITDITFNKKVLSIEQVKVIYDTTDNRGKVDSVHYRGYQNGIQLDIVVSEGNISECLLEGVGIVVGSNDKIIEADINNSSIIGGTTFEFDTQQILTKVDATNIVNNLQNYISMISKNIIMSGTVLTPKLYVGDKVIVSDTGTIYDGTYKIVNMTIKMGENYSLDATLIKIS